ncbi:hypothetical protein NFW40_03960 [Clostridioides difficile]|nr:hypothetical protein [Clostridioides difficile]
MIISKDKFNKIVKESGGIFKYICCIMSEHYCGIEGVKIGAIGNAIIIERGLLFDAVMNPKLFIPKENILRIYTSNDRILIEFKENEDKYSVSLKIKSKKNINKLVDSIKRITNENLDVLKLEHFNDEEKYQNDLDIISELEEETEEENALEELLIADLDIASIIEECEYSKVNSIKRINQLTNLSLTQCKKIVDDYFRNNSLGNIEKYDSVKTINDEKKHNNKIKKLQEEQLKLEIKNTKLSIKQQKNAIKQDKKTARCPKCGSTSLSAHKKGFGIGKAVVGAWAVGGIGLVAGNANAKKVRVTCLKCGKQFWA